MNLTRSAEAEEGGWAGMVTDPTLDGSVSVNAGFRAARQLLLDIGSLGLPTSTEYVDTITPQFVADLVSHALVGARQVGASSHTLHTGSTPRAPNWVNLTRARIGYGPSRTGSLPIREQGSPASYPPAPPAARRGHSLHAHSRLH